MPQTQIDYATVNLGAPDKIADKSNRGEACGGGAGAQTPTATKRRRESRGEMMAMLATGVQKRRRLKGMGEVKPPDAE